MRHAGPIGLILLMAACGNENGNGPAVCQEGQASCSEDALVLTVCRDGDWQTVDCMGEQGRLCEAGACVDPWRYGSPQWPRVEDEPRATEESLYQKMLYYEEISRRLHNHPRLKSHMTVRLPCKTPDNCDEPLVDPDQATWEEVEVFYSGDNDGLGNSHYLEAQAYRYAVTGEQEALEAIKLFLEGEQERMAITGVPGLFTRRMIPPDEPGVACPTDLQAYVPDVEKDDNQWVRIDDEGCFQYVDGDTLEWVTTEHCGMESFASWCMIDNVSKDEYSGHLAALGAVGKLVDDPQVQQITRDLLNQIGRHLLDHKMQFTDWDGRVTEHGRLWAYAIDDYPGFNAAMALSFIKVIAEVTGESDFHDWYHDCLLQEGGEWDCIEQPMETPRPYTEHLETASLYLGSDSCKSNWNNFSMHFQSMHNLIWFERDPELRAIYHNSLKVDVFDPPDTPKPLIDQHNTWFNFMYAAQKALGPGSDGPAYDVVEDGIRMLRQFPARKVQKELTCPPEVCVLSGCTDRFDRPLSENPREIADRCLGRFVWWGNPYSPNDCTANPRTVVSPSDYLVAYWMGRYFGFITEDM